MKAHPLGALYWPRERALIVSDLHLEKGSAFATRGVMLPPYDTRTTLMRMRRLIKELDPAMVISLGDAFHDVGAETRMDQEDEETIAELMRERRWIWILGNHDPEPPQRFAAETHAEFAIGALTFRHEPVAGAAPGEVAGHLHPCARVSTEGCIQRRRCFASDGARLIMPALGAYTGGLNILDAAFAPLFECPVAWVMGAQGVYPIGADKLVADPPDNWRESKRKFIRKVV